MLSRISSLEITAVLHSRKGRDTEAYTVWDSAIESWFQALEKKIDNAFNNNSSMQPYEGFNSEPPFASRIMQEPLPWYFKVPQFETYDGTADPVDHLETFKAVMLLQGVTDDIFY